MVGLVHLYVVIGGLLFACLFYRVPLYLLLAVFACGVAAYMWVQRQAGWRLTFGNDQGNLGFFYHRPRPRHRMPIMQQQSQRNSDHLQPGFNNYAGGPVAEAFSYTLSGNSARAKSSSSVQRRRPGYPLLDLDRTSTSPGNLPIESRRPFSHAYQQTPFGTSGHWTMADQQILTQDAMSATASNYRPTKYTGIGAYPFVNLEPRRPTILSYCNTNMIKNRVTVKVALPERTSGYNTVPLAGGNRSSSAAAAAASSSSSSTPNTPTDCTAVIEALRTTRKRPLKEDLNTQESNSNAKRRLRHKVPSSSAECFSTAASPHLPTEIAQHFESQLSDESLAILLPPMSPTPPPPLSAAPQLSTLSSQTAKKLNPPPIQQASGQIPRICCRANTNAIDSSYSSSRRHEQSENERRAKRKNESATREEPDAKMVRNPTPTEHETAPETNSTLTANESASHHEQVSEMKSATSFVETPLESKSIATDLDKNGAEKKNTYSFHSTLTGARNPMDVHIPSYIPTLEDHLEDQKADKRRLVKLLACFASQNDYTSEEVPTVEQSKPNDGSSAKPSSSTIINNQQLDSVLQQTTNSNSTMTTSSVGSYFPSPDITSVSTPQSSSNTTTVTSSLLGQQQPFLNATAVSSTSPSLTSSNPIISSKSTTMTTVVTSSTPSSCFQMMPVTTSQAIKDNQQTFTFGTNGNQAGQQPMVSSAFSSGNNNPVPSVSEAASSSNGTIQYGLEEGGANSPANVQMTATSPPSSMFNFGGNSDGIPFGERTRPIASNNSGNTNNVMHFGNLALPVNGTTSSTTSTESSNGFSFGLPPTANNNNQASINTQVFSFGTSSNTPNSAFNFSANVTPTFNMGSAATLTGFTPMSKLPETPSNMFTVGPGASQSSSTRRSKQSLSRHRSSYR